MSDAVERGIDAVTASFYTLIVSFGNPERGAWQMIILLVLIIAVIEIFVAALVVRTLWLWGEPETREPRTREPAAQPAASPAGAPFATPVGT